MALYFFRHGQTDYNAAQRFQGRKDIPLNSVGREQAFRLRQLLSSESISLTKLVSSPLSRAVETAHIISKGELETVIESDFSEIDLGEYDGRLETDLADVLGAQKYAQWRDGCFTIPAPGGESMNDARERVRSAVKRWSEISTASDIGIVAHQGILMAMKSIVSDQSDLDDLRDYKQANDEIDIWNCLESRRIRTVSLEPLNETPSAE